MNVHIHFPEHALAVLEAAGRVETDEFGSTFLAVAGRKAVVRVTPRAYQPGKLMGILIVNYPRCWNKAIADL